MGGRSTVTNLACITQTICECIDANQQLDVIYTDLSKAFDKLDHQILLSKLPSFGFDNHAINFFKSYLSGRVQFVRVGDFKSVSTHVFSGVPQGSVLGPLFFNMYINDIASCINVDFLLYADDLKIYNVISDFGSSYKLQDALENISQWCFRNRLALNVSKCMVLTYSRRKSDLLFHYNIDGTVLQRPDSLSDLGVVFDRKLSFSVHIEQTVNKCFRTLGFILRNARSFTDNNTLRLLFNAFVRSRIEYCAIVWRPMYRVHIANLERVQRRFAKYLCYRIDGAYPRRGISSRELLTRVSLEDLETRCNRARLLFLFKITHRMADCPTLLARVPVRPPQRERRTLQCFYLPAPRTDVLKSSPIYRMCNMANSMGNDLDIYTAKVSDIYALHIY